LNIHKSTGCNRFELLVPGLLGPIPLDPAALPPGQRIETPMLDLLLARGRPSATAGSDISVTGRMLGRFGADASAPYCLATDDPDWDRGGYCMHADPVHLRPDRDLLRLFDARHLGISTAEAQALVAELNGHFAADGLRFSAPIASRWYLHCEHPPALQTQPLERVIGQHIDGLLPSGADAARWASLMNEAQMLLFQSPTNQHREAEGRPSVNGVWTWGGGHWQVPTGADLPTLVHAQSPLAQGLAAAADIRVEAPSEAWLPGAGIQLADWHQLQDAVLDTDELAWAAAAESLDQRLAPLVDALRAGDLHRIIIDSCDGHCWSIDRADLRAFWRRSWPRPWRRPPTLAHRVSQSQS
jgi:hypothetical protein